MTADSRAGRTRHADLASRIVVTSLLVIAGLYFLLPVYWLIVASTKSTGDLFGSFGFWFYHPQLLTNLRDVLTFQDSVYVRWVLNSVVYSGVGALVATLLSAAAGYGLAKFAFRGRDALFNVILAGVLIPGTALALPLYLMASHLALPNTYWSVLLPSVVSPFGVYLCRIYADASVPGDLLEAARIDGASELSIFGRIVLRIMSPALVTVFLFQFVGIWNNYFLPLVMLSNPKLYPITLGLTSWQSYANREPHLGQLSVVGSLLSVLPLAILMVLLQRYWRIGLTEGSIKG
jgi:multiple sugar transport system permease protein